MAASPDHHRVAAGSAALFARAGRNSERVFLPLNSSAMQSATGRPTLYLVHSVSGAAGTDFMALAHRLDRTVRVFGIQAPPKWIEKGEFGSSIESLAEHYVEALMMFQPDGPLLIGGYCVGGLIACEMATRLIALGRTVGPVTVIDAAPENISVRGPWSASYARELIANVPRWLRHADLMRNRSVRTVLRSLAKNTAAIGKRALGFRPAEKFGGGYAINLLDMSRYPAAQRLFINRLFAAVFAYSPDRYPQEIVVYEARVTPLLYLPDYGRIWQAVAPRAQVVGILGTHIGVLQEPYVGALADDLRGRIAQYAEL